MRHPSEGALRRLVDEPDGVPGPDREHVAACARCNEQLARLRQDAVAVAMSLDVDGDVDVAAAWQRMSAVGPVSRPTAVRRAGFRQLVSRPAVGAVAVVAVLAGAGTAAANDWLQVFRTEDVAPVSITTKDLIALPDLSAYGDVVLTERPTVHSVADASAAEAESGLDVPQVADLPRGVTGDPTYQVAGRASATFTFSAERAAAAAQKAGAALPPMPSGLDGSRVRLVAGPGVAQVWTSRSGAPALLVGRATAPTAFASGVPFATMRDYLLAVPGIPKDVAAELRAFEADGSTLPLPVPADQVTASSTRVNGRPATLLETRGRAVAAVVWVDRGAVTVVAGSLDDDEVLSIARNLR